MQYPGRLVRRGELKRSVVIAIQRRLNELSVASLTDDFQIKPLRVDGDFGVKTEQAVRLFQINFTDLEGQPLQVDGVIGPATWASLFGNETVPPVIGGGSSSFLLDVLQIASDQVGVKENPIGSNRGVRVDQYIRSAGLDPNQGSFPWCVAFLYWCFNEASSKQGISNPVFQTASVHQLWHRSLNRPQTKRITPREANEKYSLVQPGQIFCLDYGSFRGHAGIIESIQDGKMLTIEGNTNIGGSREGIGVFRRHTRHIEQVDLGFIDYSAV
jgi:hypothetical protein